MSTEHRKSIRKVFYDINLEVLKGFKDCLAMPDQARGVRFDAEKFIRESEKARGSKDEILAFQKLLFPPGSKGID